VPQGSGTPAGGAGWGGPANGPGTGPPVGTPLPAWKPPTPEKLALKDLIARGKEENARRMKGIWLTVAEDETAPHMARIVAAEKWLNRELGMPNQTVNVNDLSGLTDEELRQRVEQARRRAGIAPSDEPPRLLAAPVPTATRSA